MIDVRKPTERGCGLMLRPGSTSQDIQEPGAFGTG